MEKTVKTIMISFPIEEFQSIIIECVSNCLKQHQPVQSPVEDELPDIIDISEAVKETGYTEGYVYEMKGRGDIPYIQKTKGSALRFSRSELRAWMKAGRPSILQKAVDDISNNHFGKKKKGKL